MTNADKQFHPKYQSDFIQPNQALPLGWQSVGLVLSDSVWLQGFCKHGHLQQAAKD